MNKSNRFLFSFIGLIIFQIFMSMEEIIGHLPQLITILTGRLHVRFFFLPVIQLSDQLFIFLTLIMIIILFVFLAFVFIESGWSRILIVIIGIIEILNAGLHIATTIYRLSYTPGTISAIGLIIFAFLVVFLKPSFQREEPEETE